MDRRPTYLLEFEDQLDNRIAAPQCRYDIWEVIHFDSDKNPFVRTPFVEIVNLGQRWWTMSVCDKAVDGLLGLRNGGAR